MSIFNGYLTGEDREIAIENAKLENEYRTLTTLFEMTQLQVEQMHRDAELKVFAESGTYDDLTFLYQEADAEVGEQRKNILQKIIDWFGKIFSSIGNGIKKIFGMGDANMEVEAPVEVVEKVSKIEQIWTQMQNGVAKLRNGDFSGALDILKVVAIPATIAVGGAVAYKKYKKGELDGIVKKLEGIKNQVASVFNNIKGKLTGTTNTNEQGEAQKSLNPIQKLMSWISDAIGKITGCISNAIKGMKTKGDNGDEQQTPQDQQGQQEGQKPAEEQKPEKTPEEKKEENQQKMHQQSEKKGNPNQQGTLNEEEHSVMNGGFKYIFDINTGDILRVEAPNGQKANVRANASVKKKIQKAMTRFAAGEAVGDSVPVEIIESLNEIFGDDATYAFEGSTLVVNSNKEVFESVDISIEESIFGVPVNSTVQESATDAFDQEMMDLLNDLKNL
jgi:hypothetical protein